MIDSELSALCKTLLPGLTEAVKEAAAEVQRLFLSGRFEVSEKGPGDLLTTADLKSNEILQGHLQKLLPEAAWISEESAQSADRRQHRFAWIVDPIDGTKEFAGGRPEYSISVGLVADGLAVLGGVALPAEGQLYVGGMSTGLYEVTEDSRLLKPMQAVPLAEAEVLVSSTEFENGVFNEAHFRELNLTPTGSVARKLAMVAGGRGHANISLYPKNEWDICGGIALILAAGGKAVHLDSVSGEWKAHRFNAESLLTYGLIAGSDGLVDELCNRQKTQGWTVRRTYGS